MSTYWKDGRTERSLTVAPHAGMASTLNTCGWSSSRIVISTDDGVPAVTVFGRVPSATVKVSSCSSASCAVVIVPVPLVAPELIAMLVSVPWSPDSAEPSVNVTGMATLPDSADDSVAVTVTDEPSGTGFGEAARETAGTAAGARGVPSAGAVQSLGVCSPTSIVRTRTWYGEPFVRPVKVWLVPVTSVSAPGQFAADLSLICAS